jgi:protein TonB
MRATILGVAAAVLLHAVVLLFGGILFPGPEQEEAAARVENVDLVAETDEKKEDKPADEPVDEREAEETMETASERPPDARDLEILQQEAAAAAVPELAALSLGALEDALGPGEGVDGGFGGVLNLATGGRIGGTAAPGTAAVGTQGATLVFALPDLDQKPRPIFQAEPVYPFELRQKKIEGTVYVQFIVDREGRVVEPRIEKSTHSAFDKPALDAVRQWRFEPAVRDGRPVQARLRVPIRFRKG